MTTMHRLKTIALVFGLAFSMYPGRVAMAGLAYVSTLDGYGRPEAFESVDTSTGAVTVISTSTPGLVGLQWAGGQLYGEGYGSGELYRINPTNGVATDLGTISGVPNGAGDGGSDYVTLPGGKTYYFDYQNGSVYSLSLPSLSATLTNLPYFGGDGGAGGYAAGPDGLIYGLVRGSTDTLYTLDPATGAVSAGLTLSQDFGYYSRLFFDGSKLDVISGGGNYGGAWHLYTIDTTTGLVTQDFGFSDNIGQPFAAVGPPSAVPEPSSLVMSCLGLAAGISRVLRHRGRIGQLHREASPSA